jgi:hypothetical protein
MHLAEVSKATARGKKQFRRMRRRGTTNQGILIWTKSTKTHAGCPPLTGRSGLLAALWRVRKQ